MIPAYKTMWSIFVPVFPVKRSRSFRCLILFVSLFITAGTLTSCQSSGKKSNEIPVDSLLIRLKPPDPVSPAEKNRLALACGEWYDSVLEKSGFNGGMILAKGGNIVFEKYRGTGHLGLNDTITSQTSFHIASVTKTITAMATLKLWQDGKLNIDDEYSKYFPAFNYPGVTIRTLLNHRSGLPNYLYFMEELGWNKSTYIKNQDVLDQLINHKAELTNISTPNTRFTYCNTNYALLALLIEKVSAVSYPEFVQKTFFYPLQMKHSFVFTRADSARVTPSYDWRGQLIPINYLDLVYGDKDIYSTPRDLLIWDRALRSNTIFKPEIFQQAYTPYSNERPGAKNYGLGWRMVIHPDGKKMIFHNGWWHGNNAVFIRLIEEDATIIVIGNRYTNAVYKAKNLVSLFNGQFITDEEE